MAVTRYRSGDVTVTVDDGLDRWLRGLLSIAERETVRLLEERAAKLALEARAAWYGPDGVERETGQSGDIVTVTTFDAGRGVVRVSIGSADSRTAGGKPVAVYVHQARATSLVKKTVSRAEWYATPSKRRGPIFRGDAVYRPAAGATVPEALLRYTVHASNPKARQGKFLLVELVRKPGQVLAREVAAVLAERIAAAARQAA